MVDRLLQLVYRCPGCGQPDWTEVAADTGRLECRECEWSRTVREDDIQDGTPQCCVACGCVDLWRQKDFPQRLGVLFVAAGALLSTVAIAYYRPLLALGVLMGFALVDMLLYVSMSDVLVCYRCGARHRHARLDDDHPRFNLELNERYRQEAKRLEDSKASGP